MKIVYIMSFARSGSTILNTILGTGRSVFAAGELCNIVDAIDIRREYCSCGVPSNSCAFWTEVRSEWEKSKSFQSTNEYAALIRSFEKADRLDWLRGYSRPWLHAQKRSDWRRYVDQTAALFDAISKVSGADVIIDSSKSQVRALSLSQVRGLDLRVIHLVRDVRGVVRSLNRAWESNPAGGIVEPLAAIKPSTVARRWAESNFGATRVRRALGERAMLVRYEDVTSCPDATLERVGAFAEISLSEVLSKIRHRQEFESGHQIAGNRVRMQRGIRLSPDVRWQTELTSVQKQWIWLLAGATPGLYGYRMNP